MKTKKRGLNDEVAMQKIEDCTYFRADEKSSVTGLVSSSSEGNKSQLNKPAKLNLYLLGLRSPAKRL